MSLVSLAHGRGRFSASAVVAMLFLLTHSFVWGNFVEAQTAVSEPTEDIADGDGKVFAKLQRDSIQDYELKRAGTGDADEVPLALVAIFGDSRLKHAALVNDVEFSLDGRLLASSSNDGTLRVWDAGTAEEIRRFYARPMWDNGPKHVSDVCFSPDGKILAASASQVAVFFWNVETGEEIRVIQDKMPVQTIAFHPTEPLIATGHEFEASLFNAATGERLFTFAKDADRFWRQRGHGLAEVHVAFTADGQSLVVGHPDGTIRYWDIHSGKMIKTLDTHEAVEEQESAVTCLAFSRDQTLVAASYRDGTVKVWRESSGQLLHELKAHDGRACAIEFHPQEDILASGGPNGQINLWDYETGQLLKQFSTEGTPGVVALSFRPDGRLLAVANTSIKVLDTETGQPAFNINGHDGAIHCLVAGDDGTSLTTAGADGTVLQWDVRSGLVRRIIDVGQWVNWAHLDHNGKLATIEIDGTTKIWDLATQRVEQAWRSGSPLYQQPAMSPDGRWLASHPMLPAPRGSLDIWDTQTGKFHGRIVSGEGVPFFSPDSKRLIFARGSYVDQKCLVSIWDVDKLGLSFEGSDLGLRNISAAALTVDGSTLAIAGRKRVGEEGPAEVVLLWDVQQQEVRLTLDPGPVSPTKLAWSLDGRRLASLADAKVHIWDAEDGELRETVAVANPGYWQVRDVVFSSDSGHIVVAMGNGTLQVLRIGIDRDEVAR